MTARRLVIVRLQFFTVINNIEMEGKAENEISAKRLVLFRSVLYTRRMKGGISW